MVMGYSDLSGIRANDDRLSGTLGALVTNPLEVVKTRMQSSVFRASTTRQLAAVQTSSNIWGHVVGTCSMLKDIYRLEGVAALWRGTTATLVGVIPSRAIYFSSYQWAKGALAQAYNAGEQNSWRVHLPAALFAGVAVNTATNPIWLVKTKMQLQSSLTVGAMQYQSVGECVRHVFAVDGVKGFYRGLTASYLGAVEGAVHWVTYEQFKNMFASHRSKHGGGDLHWGDYFASAALSKLLAAVVAYPHEVLRTRLREDGAKYRGLSRTFALVLKEEGAGAFYGGLTAHLMRTVPNSAIMFFTYECLMAAYRHFHQ